MQGQLHRLFLTPPTGALLLLLLVSACSAYEPEVLGISTLELRYLSEEGGRSEELLLELEARDQDGFSELDRLYVVHDEAELFWDLPSESWQTRPEEGEIRVLRLASPRGEPLPRGRYRLELFDLGGRSGEGSFTLPLLPEVEEMEVLEERIRRAGAHLNERLLGPPEGEEASQERGREELPGADALREIALLFLPAGREAPRELLNLERLGSLRQTERKELLASTLEEIGGESGRLYVGAQAGEAGPLLLLPLHDLVSGLSGEVRD
ncbi:MAG: hypothetical protein ACLFNP_03520 [Spirochaetaceae bacterium]